MKPNLCDRNALALVNCLLNQTTTSCTNDFAFVRRRFAFADRLNHHLCRNERINSNFGISRAKQFFVVDKHHLIFLTLKTKQIDSNSTCSILEQRCHADICNLEQAHPISSLFFLSSSFLVIYTDTNNAKKTRIDPLISVLRARDNGSVNFRKFLASVRHDSAGFGYIGADL